MNYLRACLLVLFLVSAGHSAQNKTLQYILPSDDELLESYLIGEITYDEYLLLLDIITNNIHPGKVILSDDIPQNVLEKYTVVTPEQDYSSEYDYEPKFRFKHMYASYLEENARTKYQSNFSYKNKNISSQVVLRRETSGRERFLNRSVTLNDVSTKLKEVRIGNFSKKFGLGLLMSYHGKNVSYSDEIDKESFLFPDYGGFNGLYTDWRYNQYRIQSISSLVRDEEFSFLTNGFSFGKSSREKEISIQTAVTTIKNRNITLSKSDFKSSLYLRKKFNRLHTKTEAAYGYYDNNSQLAVFHENRIRISDLQIDMEGWMYSDEYKDFSGAGRTSLLSEKVILPDIDYTYYSKRTHQEGMEISLSRKLKWRFSGKLTQLYAYKSKDSTELVTYAQLRNKLNMIVTLAYDFSYRQKERFSISEGSYIKRIHQITAKFNRYKTATRVALQHESKTGEEPYVGGIFEFRYKPYNFGLTQFWCNFGRYNLTTKRIDYIYMFVRNIFDITKYVKIDIKLSHRYQRDSSVKVTNQFSISIEGVI